MYLQHYKLKDSPFRVVPSPEYLFPAETHDEGRARVLYGIREGRGFVVVSGPVGVGKTTMLLSVLEELDRKTNVALVFNPLPDFGQLLRTICGEFEIEASGVDEAEALQRLNGYLLDRFALGESSVLMIDEAQNLSIEVMERVRLLSNLQTQRCSLLQIVLVGQPELIELLDDTRLRQLRQRVGVWHQIVPLELDDVQDYIYHRLRLAGAAAPRKIIPEVCCRRIHEWSRGIPRLINQICDTALVIGYGRDKLQIDLTEIDEAAAELRLESESVSLPAPERAQGRTERRTSNAASAAAYEDATASNRVGRRGIPLALAAILLAALALLGLGFGGGRWTTGLLQTRLDTLGSAMGRNLDSLASLEAASADDGAKNSTAVALSAAPAPAVQQTAAVQPLPENLALLVERSEEVAEWLADSKAVYSVHLASFHSAEQAERFVSDLSEMNPDWDAPVYLEWNENSREWYRVLSGGFLSSADARTAARSYHTRPGIGYAQLARLSSSSRILLPGSRKMLVRGEGSDDE